MNLNQTRDEPINTRDTIEQYFARLSQNDGWEALLADDVTFTSYGTPNKHVVGRGAFLRSTQGFYSMIGDVELRELLVDGDRACALTRYRLQAPDGAAFTGDVAEVFTVDEDRIDSLAIYFDSAPYPKLDRS